MAWAQPMQMLQVLQATRRRERGKTWQPECLHTNKGRIDSMTQFNTVSKSCDCRKVLHAGQGALPLGGRCQTRSADSRERKRVLCVDAHSEIRCEASRTCTQKGQQCSLHHRAEHATWNLELVDFRTWKLSGKNILELSHRYPYSGDSAGLSRVRSCVVDGVTAQLSSARLWR